MIENLTLRRQVAALKQQRPRPALYGTDLAFWVALRGSWPGWTSRLVVVNADTVARWNRDRFRRYWTKISQRHHPDRPRVDPEILHLEAIKETVPVYENHVRILQDVTISPRLPGWDSAETADSKVVLPATFSYQACDDRICYAPAKIPLTFTLNVVAHDVERVPENLRRETKKTEP